jgi:hypothetical protein
MQNPLSFKAKATQSPEGQAFVLLLQSAWRDYVAASFEVTFAVDVTA